MNLKTFALALLATGVIADHHTHNTLREIRKATNDFHERLQTWDGGYIGAVRVAMDSHSFKKTLHDALSDRSIDQAIVSTRSEVDEANTMETARDLANDVGQVVDTTINLKPKIEGIPIVGKKIGRMLFTGLQGASTNLGQEFVPRASEEHQEAAQEIIRDIDAHFLRGLEAFE